MSLTPMGRAGVPMYCLTCTSPPVGKAILSPLFRLREPGNPYSPSHQRRRTGSGRVCLVAHPTESARRDPDWLYRAHRTPPDLHLLLLKLHWLSTCRTPC